MRLPRDRSCAPVAGALLLTAMLASGCGDDSGSGSAAPANPIPDAPADDESGAPLRLSYVCGTRFVLISPHTVPVTVTWRVSGTGEEGTATLPAASAAHHPTSSEQLIETRNRGALEIYQEGRWLKTRANGGIPCTPDVPAPAFAGTGSAQTGEWGPVLPWPVVAVHASLLSSGKVLVWGSATSGAPQVWDPASDGFTPYPSPALLFCAGHAFTGGDQLVVIGGHISGDHGLPNITLFNNAAGWTSSPPMPRGRWYPTATTLADGSVLALGGSDQQAVQVTVPEIWTSTGLRELTGASLQVPYYPVSFLAPNGKVFVAGEQQMSRYLSVSGSGGWADVGLRRFGTRDQGSAVMYDEGRVLYSGGGRTTNTAETIDLRAAAPTWSWTGSMAYPRRHHNLTLLPTGEVLATGGTGGTEFNDLTRMVRAAEIWSPATGLWTTLASASVDRAYHSVALLLPDGRVLQTGGGAASVAINQFNAQLFSPPYLFRGARPRITGAPQGIGYEGAFTVTTPEAANIAKVTLIRAGSVTHGSDMNQRFQRLSFTRGSGALTVAGPSSRNTAPPGHYLLFILDENDVPSMAAIVTLGAGSAPPPPSITLTTSGRTDATKQYMTLNWTGATGTNVDVYRNGVFLGVQLNDGHYTNSRSLPGSPSYTYRICQTGSATCSNESTVNFGSGPSPTPPVARFSSSCSGLTCAFTDQSTDADGSVTSWSWTFGDGSSSTARHPSHTYAAAGTYTVSLRVVDNAGASGQASAGVTVTNGSGGIVLTVTGRKDATKQYMTLDWSGASGSNVDVYRNGPFLTATPNDGHYTNSRSLPGSTSYTYKVCQTGSSVCSNEATVTF